jgi:hypothetical protein
MSMEEKAVEGAIKALLDWFEPWIFWRVKVPVDVWKRGRATVEEIRDNARHVHESVAAGTPPRDLLESMPTREVLQRWVDQLEELSNRLPTNTRSRIRLEALVKLLGSLPMTLIHSVAMSEQAIEGKASDKTIEEMRHWYEFFADAADYKYADWIDLDAVEPDTPPSPRQPSASQEQPEIRRMLRGMNLRAARAVVKSATRVLGDMDKMRRSRPPQDP